MIVVWGMLSMAAPVLALLSGALVAAAIVARDISVMLTIPTRIGMISAAVVGYIISGGIGFAVDAELRTPIISYAFVCAVLASSLMVLAALIRWTLARKLKLTSADVTMLMHERISQR